MPRGVVGRVALPPGRLHGHRWELSVVPRLRRAGPAGPGRVLPRAARPGGAVRLLIDDFLVCNRTFKDSSYETHALFVYTVVVTIIVAGFPRTPRPRVKPRLRTCMFPFGFSFPLSAQTPHSTYTWTP